MTQTSRPLTVPWLRITAGVACALGLIGCATFTARDTSSSIGAWPAPLADNSERPGSAAGCVSCHRGIEMTSMHPGPVNVGCADCHGGHPEVQWQGELPKAPYPAEFTAKVAAAHVQPAFPAEWKGSRNPERTYALLNREKLEYVRFINPGDLRVADQTCGPCHQGIVDRVKTSIMAHSATVPGAGSYNNGVLTNKVYVVGELYAPNGQSAIAKMDPPPTPEEAARGVIPQLIPVPRYNISQPGNIFRAAERGQANQRGLGTGTRVDFAHFVLTKTRLNDPYLWFLGTNDYAGEYRSSGCSACHVLYANDEGDAGGNVKELGHGGTSSTDDPMIPKNEPGHPIRHMFTRQIPSSQCLTCHSHQGSGAIENYAGAMWWDGETDGKSFYNADGSPKQGKALHEVHTEANKKAVHTQFTSQHRSGWTFRNVYKTDWQGQMIGRDGKLIDWDDPNWVDKAVHLVDHHFEVGMQCIDCHTEQDAHGDGRLYGEMMNAVEIYCTDCHGTVQDYSNLTTSNLPGNGNNGKGTDLALAKASGRPQFEWVEQDGRKQLVQRSKVSDKTWVVPQLRDVVDPGSPKYNEKAAVAKTLQAGTGTFGNRDLPASSFAHSTDKMTCYTCHTSWALSCSGCHLAGKVNRRTAHNHFWGEKTQVHVGYYSQGLRNDCLILGINGNVKGNKIAPVRSASAPIATAENGNRAVVTHQQPTIAASGHSGTSFSPYIPHTMTKEGQACTSCHVSEADDNNAQLAERFNLGAHATDFVGQYVHVATPEGVAAVRVTDGWEPQPVMGSDFHEMTMPASFKELVAANRELGEVHRHDSAGARTVQARGEYLYVADGPGGLRVFDIANIANKDVAQRIVSAPFSPLGHQAHVATADATAVVLPTTVPMDPLRKSDPANCELPVHPLFGYAYVTDRKEGLVVVDVNTFVDGDPDNNFIERATTYNPGGKLTGTTGGIVVGRYLYLLGPYGLAIVDIDKPTHPALVRTLEGALRDPRAIDVQFRYAAVTDADGMKVLDVTDIQNPVLVPNATIPLADARGVRICRTYAYVCAGKDGIAIVDVRRFRQPALVEKFNAGGAINDATAITTGLTNASLFGYVADGKNGLRVIELWAPSRSKGTYGFSPKPTPRLIASCQAPAGACAISTGQVRDRGVDESGNQIGVYGRLGSRPLDQKTREGFYLRNGKVYTVRDDAKGYQKK